MLIPREGSLRLAAFGNLRIVCEPMAMSSALDLIVGISPPPSPPARPDALAVSHWRTETSRGPLPRYSAVPGRLNTNDTSCDPRPLAT